MQFFVGQGHDGAERPGGQRAAQRPATVLGRLQDPRVRGEHGVVHLHRLAYGPRLPEGRRIPDARTPSGWGGTPTGSAMFAASMQRNARSSRIGEPRAPARRGRGRLVRWPRAAVARIRVESGELSRVELAGAAARRHHRPDLRGGVLALRQRPRRDGAPPRSAVRWEGDRQLVVSPLRRVGAGDVRDWLTLWLGVARDWALVNGLRLLFGEG